MSQANRYSRKVATRSVEKVYLIVTEGATEAQYMECFKRKPGPIIEVVDGSDNKRSLVEKALDIRQKYVDSEDFFLEDDECWVIMDRDVDGRNKVDADNFNQALQVAKNNQIEVAWSNDSFELWLLLHFQEVQAALHRKVINEKLKPHIGKKYEKAKGTEMYELTKNNRNTAIKRAIQLERASANVSPSEANPCTLVHLLVQKLESGSFFRAN